MEWRESAKGGIVNITIPLQNWKHNKSPLFQHKQNPKNGDGSGKP